MELGSSYSSFNAASTMPSFSMASTVEVQSYPSDRKPARLVIVYGISSAQETKVIVGRLKGKLEGSDEKKNDYGEALSLQSAEEIQRQRRTHMPDRVESSLEIMGRLESLDRDGIALLLQEKISLSEGKLVHAHIVRNGLDGDKFLSNLLVSMYGRYGLVEDACSVFGSMPYRSVVSWSAMISACSQHGDAQKALTLFQHMQEAGLKPNNITFVSVLTACATLSTLEDGRLLHAQLVEYGIDIDAVLGTALLNMYGKCQDLEAARQVFNNMPIHDTVAWNALIAAYEQEDHSIDAGKVFELMQKKEIQPDKSTFVSTLTAYANVAGIAGGRLIHTCIVKGGLDSDLEVANTLVHMYGMCGTVEDARSVFDRMQHRDVVSWNSTIAAYAQGGLFMEAFNLFQQMLGKHVKPTHVTFLNTLSACSAPEALPIGKRIHAHVSEARCETDMLVATALVNMYGKCGATEDARVVFNKIESPDAICWNAMIACYAQQGQGMRALHLFRKMQQNGLEPDEVTFSSILSACSDLGALPEGKLIHACAVDNGFDSNVVVVHALIHMYGKCGKLDEARALFDNIRPQELISWNVMITAYAQQGHGRKAVELYEKMLQKEVTPNEVTFVSLISACSHAGLVNEGYGYFVSMSEVYSLTPLLEHYVCLIDLFGRAGRLGEAEDLIHIMPYEATSAVWSALLSGCRLHGDLERAKLAAEKLFELDPRAETSYVLLSNIYSAEGRWVDAERVRKAMLERGVKKVPGCSWIEVDNKVHRFYVRDRSHPQSDEIYAELERMMKEMKVAGYVPNTKLVLHDVDEEVKEHLLSHHSEKLAVVFGLISTPSGAPLHINKNLRVCSDCHNAVKFMSKLAKREIVLRDSTRFHHFQHGMCSCGDFW